ncbi:proteinase-activated receptor 2-like [Centroberyx gerrardi]|uniref:proteinase-activated receptor 2-like n=1 Tax=Centroberyx gerrardi TaxID=166262 RepID=UPI003AAFC532
MYGMYENTTFPCGKDPPYYTSTIGIVVDWVIFFVGLPSVCLAGYALLSLLKKDQAAPIFAINLLLSDLLQISITIVFIINRFFDDAFQPFVRVRCFTRLFVRTGLCASLGFMVLISVERYLLVGCPVWYHMKNNAKLPTLISICLWTLSLTYATLDYVFLINPRFSLLLFSAICLLPAPFLAGFFAATWKALHKSMAMRQEARNRRRVLGALSLVLGIYIVLFLPFSFRNLYYSLKDDMDTEDSVRDLSSVLTSALVYLSPLTDPFIYIFMRRDIKDTVEAFPCCSVCQGELTESTQGETALNNMQTTEGASTPI